MTSEKSINMKSLLLVLYMISTMLAVGITLSSCRSVNRIGEQSEKTQVWEDEFVISAEDLYKKPDKDEATSSKEVDECSKKCEIEMIKRGYLVTSKVEHSTFITGTGRPVFNTEGKPKYTGYFQMDCAQQRIILSDADANYVAEDTMFTVFPSCVVLDVAIPTENKMEDTCIKFIEACKQKDRRIGVKDYASKALTQSDVFRIHYKTAQPSIWVIQKLVEK